MRKVCLRCNEPREIEDFWRNSSFADGREATSTDHLDDFESADAFERALRAHETPYIRIGDTFLFPKKCEEMRWLYLIDVNYTGRMITSKPIYAGDKIADMMDVLYW